MQELARAKVNLCLHVTGRRTDGYHLLDSVAVFAGAADMLSAAAEPGLSLRIEGPFAAGLSNGDDNLVIRAARALAERAGRTHGARLMLHKALPVASGIGGGSADAAATLRLLARLWDVGDAAYQALPELAAQLGADVAVCLAGVPARMRGVGEQVEPLTLPRCGLLLVNSGHPVATRVVFDALRDAPDASWAAPLTPPPSHDLSALIGWLRETRNDLQAPAIRLCPPIADVLGAIARTPGCLLTRMSGSGATCFGMYEGAAAATRAAEAVQRPDWWVWAG